MRQEDKEKRKRERERERDGRKRERGRHVGERCTRKDKQRQQHLTARKKD